MKQSYITAIEANEKNGRNNIQRKLLTPSIIEKASDNLPVKSAYTVANNTIELFSNVLKALGDITDDGIRRQVVNILKQISTALDRVDASSHRFRKLSAFQNEDGSFLLEWHFSGFHIGLSLEPCENDSYYFIVSFDESIGEVDTRTRRINGEVDMVINDIIQFVIQNA